MVDHDTHTAVVVQRNDLLNANAQLLARVIKLEREAKEAAEQKKPARKK